MIAPKPAPASAKRASGAEAVAAALARARLDGRSIVFTNGCFDLLHCGHVALLEQARALGDLLVVGVNTDESVRALKGPGRPLNPLAARVDVLAALTCVDLVVPFPERRPTRLIRLVRPNVYVKGADYTGKRLAETALVSALGGEVVLLPYLDGYSTSGLIERIRQCG